MLRPHLNIAPLGDAALMVELASAISLDAYDAVQAALCLVRGAVDAGQLVGITEYVPAFTTLAIFYNPLQISFVELSSALQALFAASEPRSSAEPHTRTRASATVEIPICYEPKFAPDTDDIARRAGLSREQVVALHTGGEYCVAMIGFTPGFPYLLGLDELLHTPRKPQPRTRVEAGSVAIGGAQTGIYPIASPGGWNIIGRTPLQLFTPASEHPCVLQAGDAVRFRAMSAGDFFSALSG